MPDLLEDGEVKAPDSVISSLSSLISAPSSVTMLDKGNR